MPDLLDETLIPVTEVPNLPFFKKLPRPPAFSTLELWMKKGLKGAVLETMKIAGRRMTSVEAVERFIRETSDRSKFQQK